jgi:hypothetical protein
MGPKGHAVVEIAPEIKHSLGNEDEARDQTTGVEPSASLIYEHIPPGSSFLSRCKSLFESPSVLWTISLFP